MHRTWKIVLQATHQEKQAIQKEAFERCQLVSVLTLASKTAKIWSQESDNELTCSLHQPVAGYSKPINTSGFITFVFLPSVAKVSTPRIQKITLQLEVRSIRRWKLLRKLKRRSCITWGVHIAVVGVDSHDILKGEWSCTRSWWIEVQVVQPMKVVAWTCEANQLKKGPRFINQVNSFVSQEKAASETSIITKCSLQKKIKWMALLP
jgi:hypothetical protein